MQDCAAFSGRRRTFIRGKMWALCGSRTTLRPDKQHAGCVRVRCFKADIRDILSFAASAFTNL